MPKSYSGSIVAAVVCLRPVYSPDIKPVHVRLLLKVKSKYVFTPHSLPLLSDNSNELFDVYLFLPK